MCLVPQLNLLPLLVLAILVKILHMEKVRTHLTLFTTTLTTEEINHFNEEFYDQMMTERFVCKHMQDYPGGIDQYFENYKGKSATWIYNTSCKVKDLD